MQLMLAFLNSIEKDARITTAHIGVYVCLWKLRKEHNDAAQLYLFSHEVMKICKVSASSTYHKTIKELHEYGYINYVPSFNHCEGSLIEFVALDKK